MSEPTKRGLRPAQAAEKCGIALPTLYRYLKLNPQFPRPYKLSPRVTLFDEAEIDAYLSKLQAASSGKAVPA